MVCINIKELATRLDLSMLFWKPWGDIMKTSQWAMQYHDKGGKTWIVQHNPLKYKQYLYFLGQLWENKEQRSSRENQDENTTINMRR